MASSRTVGGIASRRSCQTARDKSNRDVETARKSHLGWSKMLTFSRDQREIFCTPGIAAGELVDRAVFGVRRPSRSLRYVDMKIAPSGRRLAFVQAEKGVSTLRIGDLDGSNSEVCTSSSAYLRPLAFSADDKLLIAMSSRDNENRIILCRSSGGVIRSWPNTTMWERLRESRCSVSQTPVG